MVKTSHSETGRSSGAGLQFFFDPGGLAGLVAQIVEFCPSDLASALYLDVGDHRAMGLEDALHAFAMRDFTH